ncbi:DUF6153 family protein [Nocardioides panzhihuensis]|uniref:DUF6153 family protein n=1 Tax=Nocardioides panzhihuensis TaxID=860243 RepID=UPI0024838F62|nr:DUF6153 family protein [Nocardioides panzhihuensis]
MQDLRTATHIGGARLAFAAVAVALFGLLSMHGWGSHAGAHTMGALPQSGGVVMAAGHGGPHELAATTVDESPATAAPRGATDSQMPGSDGGGSILGLCLAILTGLILGFALLMARRGIRVLRHLVPTWSTPVLYGRDRDPPDLLQLCVIRC